MNPALGMATRLGLVPRDRCELCGKETGRRGHRFCSVACSSVGTRIPVETRLWAKVAKGDGCWLWTGSVEQDGYGRIWAGGPRTQRRSILTHRLSYEIAHGPIAPGMQVCHRCDVPACVRPDHLFLGTAVENQHDKVRKGRQARGERSGNARLTVKDVHVLRSLFAAGPTNDCHLAQRYGVSPTVIRHLRVGLTWRHVPGGPTQKPPLLRTGRPFIVRSS